MRHCCVLTAAAALACSAAVAGEALPTFARKPAVTKAGDRTRIEFAVDRETDVAVWVEDAKGGIVRHLVAGVLGRNAPPPLAPGLARALSGRQGRLRRPSTLHVHPPPFRVG